MAATVDQMLSKIALDLQETDNSFSSGLWTRSEMYGYINYAIYSFLNDTGIIISDNTITASIGVRSYTRPDNSADIDRIGFDGKRVRRISLFDLASKNPSWRSTNGIPQFYYEDAAEITEFDFDKLPTKAGTIRIFADLLPVEVDDLADVIEIPDCWEPYIRWEVISFALQKDGESQDLPRADWAHNKYLFGVSLAQRIVAGMPDDPIPQIGV